MPSSNINFNGSTLILPSVAYEANVSNVLPVGTAVTNTLIFIGQSYGGKPLTPYTFTNPNTLKSFMRGSPSADFVDWMVSPSGQLNGAQTITLISPSPSTAASGIIYNAVSQPLVTLTAEDYGAPGNTIKFKLENGSTSGYKLTVDDPYLNQEYVGDNLTAPFNLTYTGTSTGVTYTVTLSSSGNSLSDAITFETSGAAAGENVNIDLTTSAYDTISKLIEYLNSTGFYQATLLSDNSGNQPSANLASSSATSLPSGTPTPVSSKITSFAYWLNTAAVSGTCSGTAITTPPSSGTTTPSLSTWTNFTGGSNGVPQSSDYSNALNAALNVGGAVIFVDSSDPAIQTLASEHAKTASSSTYNEWRRYVTGSALGDSISTTETNSRALNTIYSTYVYPGIKKVDTTTGITKTYAGLYAAAAVAGMMAGNPPALPLTNKSLTGIGVEASLTVANIDALQQAGVMCIYVPSTTKVPTIVSDFTCWQNDNNPENVFNQQVACRNFLGYSITQGLQPYIGSVASTLTLTTVKNKIKDILNYLQYNPASGNGILNSWDKTSLVLDYNGTTQALSVSVSVQLVGQYRFILFTTIVNPLNISA